MANGWWRWLMADSVSNLVRANQDALRNPANIGRFHSGAVHGQAQAANDMIAGIENGRCDPGGASRIAAPVAGNNNRPDRIRGAIGG